MVNFLDGESRHNLDEWYQRVKQAGLLRGFSRETKDAFCHLLKCAPNIVSWQQLLRTGWHRSADKGNEHTEANCVNNAIRRLRDRLNIYYSGQGKDDKVRVRIESPHGKGYYILLDIRDTIQGPRNDKVGTSYQPFFYLDRESIPIAELLRTPSPIPLERVKLEIREGSDYELPKVIQGEPAKQLWKRYQQKCADENRVCENHMKYRVDGWDITRDKFKSPGFRLLGQRAWYYDFAVTNASLNEEITSNDGRKAQVRELITFAPGSRSCECANPLSLNVILLIEDGARAVVALRGEKHAVDWLRWGPSFNGTITLDDGHATQRPLPLQAFAEKMALEKLGIAIDGSKVEILSLAVGLKKGQWALLGMLTTSLSENDVKLGLQNTIGWQITDLRFISFTEQEIFRFIDEENRGKVKCMPYLEVGLANALRHSK